MENAVILEKKAEIFKRIKDKANVVNVKLITMFSDDLEAHQIYENSLWLIAEKELLKEILFLGDDISLCKDYLFKVENEKYSHWRVVRGDLEAKFTDKPINPYVKKFEEARLMCCTHWQLYFERNERILEDLKRSLIFNEKLEL